MVWRAGFGQRTLCLTHVPYDIISRVPYISLVSGRDQSDKICKILVTQAHVQTLILKSPVLSIRAEGGDRLSELCIQHALCKQSTKPFNIWWLQMDGQRPALLLKRQHTCPLRTPTAYFGLHRGRWETNHPTHRGSNSDCYPEKKTADVRKFPAF